MLGDGGIDAVYDLLGYGEVPGDGPQFVPVVLQDYGGKQDERADDSAPPKHRRVCKGACSGSSAFSGSTVAQQAQKEVPAAMPR